MSLSPTYSSGASAPAPLAPPLNPLRRLGDAVLNALLRPLVERHQRAMLHAELSALDHRERKDIGIADLDTFVAGWRPDQRG